MRVSAKHAADLRCLLFRVRTRSCAVPLRYVSEIMRPLPLAPLVGIPDFVLGLAMIRGEATPVVDAAALFDTARADEPTRFVLLKVEQRAVALAVDAVIGVRALPADLQDLPPLVREANPLAIDAVGALDAQLLLVLRGAHLLPDSLLDTLDAGARGW
jgi:purine-binding chemotaxis protein CheW